MSPIESVARIYQIKKNILKKEIKEKGISRKCRFMSRGRQRKQRHTKKNMK